MNTGSGSPHRKYLTPTSEPNPSGGAYLNVAADAATVCSTTSNRSVLMRTKYGRLGVGLPVISVNGDVPEEPDRERLFDGNEHNNERQRGNEQGGESGSEDDTDMLTTLSKVVTTKSLRLQRVTRLIEASQSMASAKIKKRIKEVVFMRIVFLKVGEINTAMETFAADVFIQARWQEPMFDGQLDMKTEHVNWMRYWNPRLTIDNCVGDPKETVWYSIMFNSRQKAYMVERRRIKSTFVQNLELSQFPFDTQEIEIRVVSELSSDEVVLAEDSSELSTVNIQSFVDKQEWRLYRNVEVRKRIINLVYTAADNACKHPSFSVLCNASRRFGFYFWNIIFVMFFISSMAFCPFSVTLVKPENRLQLTFILLLTTITFKFAVSNSLPRISYLTYLDNYILVSMVFMGVVCMWHAVAPSIGILWADKGVLIGLGVLFTSLNLGFFVFIHHFVISKRNKYLEQEQLHKRRIKIQQNIPADQALRDVRATQLNVTMDSMEDVI